MEVVEKNIVVLDHCQTIQTSNLALLNLEPGISGLILVSDKSASLASLLERIPNILLLTPRLHEKSAIESAQILKRQNPGARLIIIYWVKSAKRSHLESVAHVESDLDRKKLLDSIGKDLIPLSNGTLTAREKQVIQFLAKGARFLDIARELNISRETVRSHSQNIIRKLGARNRCDAIAKYCYYSSSELVHA
jgi:DNA-binding NarL/FixJ family response regulator